jgi:4-hydroxybutyrate CoA-transferase
MPMGPTPYAELPASAHLKIQSFFPGKGLRAAVTAGRAKSLRYPLSAIPDLFDLRVIQADALLLQVTPPDKQGRVSLGVSVDYMRAVLRQKPLVIAEINPGLPRTCGATSFDSGLIDYYLETSNTPQQVPPIPADEVDRRIAQRVADLIDDGAVLQLGIGALPDQVLRCLHDRRHLGLHSGLLTDAAWPLIESGVIDNSTKRIFAGVSVTSMAAGTCAFYDFLDRNVAIEFHACSVTHDATTLASIDGLTAINSVLQLDLSGQANAETVAGRVVAAPGGLPDFARGAHQARRGRSIIALRASYRDQSNIVARLDPSTPVTLGPENVDYVVTEFGTAQLRGRTPMERVRSLINVADPARQSALERSLSVSGY